MLFKSIYSPTKESAQRKENIEAFNQVGSDMTRGKVEEISGKLKGKEVSRSTNQLQNFGPRIRPI
jgi:hypothetical protein